MFQPQEIIEALPIIASLVLIEGLLSVDNALAIAAMASHLPPEKQRLALRLGLIGAYVFRGLSLACASWIISNRWVMVLGALYLVYLMCAHITRSAEAQEEKKTAPPGLIQTVLQIELMDLSLSVDNVVAAVIFSDKLWVVCTGVFIGILTLRFVAGYCITLIQKFPVLGNTAFLLVGYVGGLLFFELGTGRDVSSLEKFGGICVVLIACIAYERFGAIRRVVRPLLKFPILLMWAFAALFDGIFWPLRKLHEVLTRVFLRKRAVESGIPQSGAE